MTPRAIVWLLPIVLVLVVVLLGVLVWAKTRPMGATTEKSEKKDLSKVWSWPAWKLVGKLLVLTAVGTGVFLLFNANVFQQFQILEFPFPLFRKVEVEAKSATTGLSPVSSTESIREIARIPLLGEGVESEKAVTIPGNVPPLWYYYFEGPPTAKVSFNGGEVLPLTGPFGQKGGILSFSGPAGTEVVVRAYPPPK